LALVKYVVFHPVKALIILLVGALLGLGSFYAYQLSSALAAVAVEDFDPGDARSDIEATEDPVPGTAPPLHFDYFDEPVFDLDQEMALIEERLATVAGDEEFNAAARGEPMPDEVFESYLLVGTDASGYLADTIILALQPVEGAPILVSLPRDLYVWNLCKGSFTRLNTGLGGCSEAASGSELLAIMVEDYTGIPIDHLARINFAGFARVVDVMGGIDVCVDRPTRDLKSHLLIESTGCQRVDGETALAWVRSRHQEQLSDGVWQASGGSDFARQQRQQDALFQLAARAAGFSSPGSLTNKLAAVTSSVRVDSSWSFGQAVATAWRYRGIDKSQVRRFSIEVANYRTSYGAAVLLPTVAFRDQLAGVFDLG
jgi:LCP family protein required for cell wall assembly